MGIIDTLSAGFRLVSRRLWLLLLPIALDLFLLLGPKLSALPVITQVYQGLLATQGALQQSGTEALNAEMLATLNELVNEVLGRFNIFALITGIRLGFPSIAGGRPIDTATDVVYTISSPGELLLWQIGLLSLGLLLTTAFLVLIAQAIREHHDGFAETVHHIISSWLKLLALLAPLGLCFVVGLSVLALMPPGFSLLVMMALSIALVWAAIYLAFVPEAITLFHDSALGALSSSFRLVRNNLGASAGLLILIMVLRTGMDFIWSSLLLRSQLAALVAIVGSAYIGTSLTAALFFFYRDRLARLHQPQETRGIRL